LNPNTDIIISPLSINMALTVLLMGSSGNTYKQMLSGLKYPSNYSNNLIQSNGNLLVKAVEKGGGASMGEFQIVVHCI
jgi:serine protease inhibitor